MKQPVGIPRDPKNQRLYLDGFIHALTGMEPKPMRRANPAYEDGYETGRLVFGRLAGETLGQAEAFLEVRIPQLRSQDRPMGFDAETRLLGYFGKLHWAVNDWLASAPGPGEAERKGRIQAAMELPPDLEAALEGPRGRAMVDD